MVWAVLVLLVVAFGVGFVAVQRRRRCGAWGETLGPPTRREGFIAGSTAAALLGMIALAAALLRPDAQCQNRRLGEASASGLTALMFEHSCGATTGFSTQIALVRSGEPLPDAGNVFVVDDDHGRAPAAAWGGPWAAMRWAGGDLVVRYDERARVLHQSGNVAGIRIRFEAAPAAEVDALLRQSRNR